MNTPDYQRAPICSVCEDTDVWALVIESEPVCEHCVRKHHPELIEDAFKADTPYVLKASDFTPIDKLVSYAIRVGRFEAMIEAHGREVRKLREMVTCPDCKLSNADDHYDAEHQICHIYEQGYADWQSEQMEKFND